MDETLKRRLIGAGLLLAAAFLLVSMLPEPRLRTAPEEDLRVVTIDLQNPDAIVEVPAEPQTPALEAPQAAVAAVPAPSEDAPPELDAEPQRSPPPPQAGAPRSQPQPAPTVVARAEPPAPAQVEPPQPAAAKPQSAEAAPAGSAPAATKPAAPAAGAGAQWWVQIGSYSDIANARQVEARLRALGQPAIVAPVETGKGTLYRVRGGPYAGEAQAQSAHALIARSGYAEARVVRP